MPQGDSVEAADNGAVYWDGEEDKETFQKEFHWFLKFLTANIHSLFFFLKPIVFLFGVHPGSHFYFFHWLLPIVYYNFQWLFDPRVLGRQF